MHLQAPWRHLCANPARRNISASSPTGCISSSSQHGQTGMQEAPPQKALSATVARRAATGVGSVDGVWHHWHARTLHVGCAICVSRKAENCFPSQAAALDAAASGMQADKANIGRIEEPALPSGAWLLHAVATARPGAVARLKQHRAACIASKPLQHAHRRRKWHTHQGHTRMQTTQTAGMLFKCQQLSSRCRRHNSTQPYPSFNLPFSSSSCCCCCC
jgi:hypothetical protein